MLILRVPDHPGVGAPPEEFEAPVIPLSPYGNVAESEIILGGCYHEFGFRTGHEGSCRIERERLLVVQVPFNKMDAFATAWGKPVLEVMLYLGIDGPKVEKLIPDAFVTALQEGRRLNFSLLQKWLKWQLEAMKASGREDQINQIVEKVMLAKAALESES